MIEIKNVNKKFANYNVLKNINAFVLKGKVVALIGPSGSGKSTLLRCLNLLEKPDAGSILIDHKDITNLKYQQHNLCKTIGMVFQNFNLFANMTAKENIKFALIKGAKKSPAVATDIANDLLTKVKLIAKADSYPSKLSGGEKQRVAIARALALQPKIMLFDEPTSSLDPQMVIEVLDVINELVIKQHMTTLIVTHEMDFARKVADEIWFLYNGQIIEQQSVNNFFLAPQTLQARQFLQLN